MTLYRQIYRTIVLTLCVFLTANGALAQVICRNPADIGHAKELYEQAQHKPGTDEAVILLYGSIKICPGIFQSYQVLANDLIQLERYAEAETIANNALQLAASPDNRLKAWVFVAEARRGQGNWNGAKLAYDYANQQAQGNAPRWFLDAYSAFENALAERGLKADEITRALKSMRATGAVPRISLRIEFEYDSTTMTDQGQAQLREMATVMDAPGFTDMQFKVIGHTDERGDDDYNLELSQRRAAAVVVELDRLKNGLASRLQEEGQGEKQLRIPNAITDSDHALNRRVEFEIFGSH